MKINELYNKMSEHFPRELSCEWDNDGLMCTRDAGAEVKKVLLSLDVTEAAVDYACKNGFDLIVSHHPLIFRKLGAVTPENYVSKKVIRLLADKVSVFSFHTRADTAEGGVNDALASVLGLANVKAFGEEEAMGRIGSLPSPMALADFAVLVKNALGADKVCYSGKGECKKVAVLGGDGKDFIPDAIKAGADTFVSGSISYNVMLDAPEMGISIIEAGHFHTENPVLTVYEQLIRGYCPDAQIEKFSSNCIKTL